MGLFQGILGNASKKDNEEFLASWSSLISQNENVCASYKLVRDWLVITDKRLIYIDVKGVTGTKKSIKSIPWRHIVAFEIVSAGIADLNAELHLWTSASVIGLELTFSASVNIYEVQGIISDAIVNFGGSSYLVSTPDTSEPEVKEKQKTLDDIEL